MKVSTIIPIYNSEKYLRECVESILNQTYKDIECILVDDGSTDNSPSICDEYAEKDSRVKVIHQKNARIGAARNAGIEIAEGEFITFIDSDDRLELNAYETAVRIITEKKADIVQWDVQYFYSNDFSSKELNRAKCNDEVIIEGSALEMMHYMYDLKSENSHFNNIGVSTHCVWTKLCARHLFDRGLRFPVNKEFEDEFMSTKLYMNANKIVTINARFSNYRLHQSSTIHTMPLNGSFNRAEAAVERLQYVLSQDDEALKKLAVSDFVVSIVNLYLKAHAQKNTEYDNFIFNMCDIVNGYKKYMSRTKRVAFETFSISPKMFSVIYSGYGKFKQLIGK